MNIQSSNINLTLPTALNNTNLGKSLNNVKTANKADLTQQNASTDNRSISADKRATIKTLNNTNQFDKLNRSPKENIFVPKSIQNYLDNANLINQAQRDELHSLLGVDIYI